MELFIAWLVVLAPFAALGLALLSGKLLFPTDKNLLKKIREEEMKERLNIRPSGLVEEMRRKIKPLKITSSTKIVFKFPAKNGC